MKYYKLIKVSDYSEAKDKLNITKGKIEHLTKQLLYLDEIKISSENIYNYFINKSLNIKKLKGFNEGNIDFDWKELIQSIEGLKKPPKDFCNSLNNDTINLEKLPNKGFLGVGYLMDFAQGVRQTSFRMMMMFGLFGGLLGVTFSQDLQSVSTVLMLIIASIYFYRIYKNVTEDTPTKNTIQRLDFISEILNIRLSNYKTELKKISMKKIIKVTNQIYL